MAHAKSHKDRVRSRTRLWQAGAVLLVGGAGALALLPLSERLGPPPAVVETSTPEGGDAAAAEELKNRLLQGESVSAGSDLSKVAAILAALGPEWKVTTAAAPPPPPPVTPTPTTEPARAAGPSGPGLEFLGWITSPKGDRTALVRHNSRQLFIREGAARDGVKVAKIDADHAMIALGDAEPTRVALTPRASSWAQPTGARAIPGMPFTPGMNGGNIPPNAMPVQPINVPPRPALDPRAASSVQMMEPGLRDSLLKEIADPGSDAESRSRAMREIGIHAGMTPQQRDELLRAAGYEINSNPIVRDLINDAFSVINSVPRGGDAKARWEEQLNRGGRR